MNKAKMLIACLAAAAAVSGSIVPFSNTAEARRVHVGNHRVHVNRHYYNGRRIARGVAVGTVARSSYRYSCGNLAYRCNRGEVWACIDHDTRCY